MSRIDPQQLLSTLDLLLSANGGIKSNGEVGRLVMLMSKFSKKLVSRCVYVQILLATTQPLLIVFLDQGGWNLISAWFVEAVQSENWPFTAELVQLVSMLPVTGALLRKSSTQQATAVPKLINQLRSNASLEANVRLIASNVYDDWVRMVAQDTKVHQNTTSGDDQPVGRLTRAHAHQIEQTRKSVKLRLKVTTHMDEVNTIVNNHDSNVTPKKSPVKTVDTATATVQSPPDNALSVLESLSDQVIQELDQDKGKKRRSVDQVDALAEDLNSKRVKVVDRRDKTKDEPSAVVDKKMDKTVVEKKPPVAAAPVATTKKKASLSSSVGAVDKKSRRYRLDQRDEVHEDERLRIKELARKLKSEAGKQGDLGSGLHVNKPIPPLAKIPKLVPKKVTPSFGEALGMMDVAKKTVKTPINKNKTASLLAGMTKNASSSETTSLSHSSARKSSGKISAASSAGAAKRPAASSVLLLPSVVRGGNGKENRQLQGGDKLTPLPPSSSVDLLASHSLSTDYKPASDRLTNASDKKVNVPNVNDCVDQQPSLIDSIMGEMRQTRSASTKAASTASVQVSTVKVDESENAEAVLPDIAEPRHSFPTLYKDMLVDVGQQPDLRESNTKSNGDLNDKMDDMESDAGAAEEDEEDALFMGKDDDDDDDEEDVGDGGGEFGEALTFANADSSSSKSEFVDLKGILVYHRPMKMANETTDSADSKSISWAPESRLVSFSYFEMDESERVNVNRLKFESMRAAEAQSERSAMNKNKVTTPGSNASAATSEGQHKVIPLTPNADSSSSNAIFMAGQRTMNANVVGPSGSSVDGKWKHLLIQWYAPRKIDLSALRGDPESERVAAGCNSVERNEQTQREKNVLQALYFSMAAVPSSPAEPSYATTGGQAANLTRPERQIPKNCDPPAPDGPPDDSIYDYSRGSQMVRWPRNLPPSSLAANLSATPSTSAGTSTASSANLGQASNLALPSALTSLFNRFGGSSAADHQQQLSTDVLPTDVHKSDRGVLPNFTESTANVAKNESMPEEDDIRLSDRYQGRRKSSEHINGIDTHPSLDGPAPNCELVGPEAGMHYDEYRPDGARHNNYMPARGGGVRHPRGFDPHHSNMRHMMPGPGMMGNNFARPYGRGGMPMRHEMPFHGPRNGRHMGGRGGQFRPVMHRPPKFPGGPNGGRGVSNRPCTYWMRKGQCRDGMSCKFRHDMST